MSEDAKLFFSNIIKSKTNNIFIHVLKFFLLLLSWPYRLIMAVRNWAYDLGFLSSESPSNTLIISIGNIVAGGTGKTPVAIMLGKAIEKFNVPFAILSRGYKSPAEKLSKPIFLSKGSGALLSATECGDEPFLIAQRLPQATILVGKNRRQAAAMAKQSGARVIIVDDGLQHRSLNRDLNIVVMNAHDPFGQGYLLPRGFLRESPKSLSRADLIILNNIQDHTQYYALSKQIHSYCKCPIIGTQLNVTHIKDSQKNQVASIQGKRVGIFCGIAHPELFKATVEKLGAIVVAEKIFPDHIGFEQSDYLDFEKECLSKNVEMLVCTEKDYVKRLNVVDLSLPLIWLEMDLQIVEGNENWETFLTRVQEQIADLGTLHETLG